MIKILFFYLCFSRYNFITFFVQLTKKKKKKKEAAQKKMIKIPSYFLSLRYIKVYFITFLV